MDEAGRYESQINCLINVLDEPRWKSQTIQTFFQGTNIKYFAVIDDNPPPSDSDKMNLLNQMLESAKLKDKELNLERDIVKEDKRKTENSPWLGRMDWKEMFLGQDMKRCKGTSPNVTAIAI